MFRQRKLNRLKPILKLTLYILLYTKETFIKVKVENTFVEFQEMLISE